MTDPLPALTLAALRNALVLLSQREWDERDARVVETIRKVLDVAERSKAK